MPSPPVAQHAGSSFAATRWSIVLAAGKGHASTEARRAMGELAKLYWYPLYAFVRRKGYSPAEAEDLIQSFFARLVEKEVLAVADRNKGKFRSFLRTAMQNFLTNTWDMARAEKRGGGNAVLSLDGLPAEDRYLGEPIDSVTPEHLFERRWALALLDQVLKRLRDEYASRGQATLFESLEASLVGGQKAGHADAAQKLGMTEGALKVAAHRLRRRYRDFLREEISQTLSNPDDADEEIRYLLTCL